MRGRKGKVSMTGLSQSALPELPPLSEVVAGRTPRVVTAGRVPASAAKRGKKNASAKSALAPQERVLATQDLILIAVLLAAGAVLKLTVASLFQSFGMKPNFIIAMYCLAIILTRPRVGQALVIGLIAGLICQLPMLNATPGLNIVSEALGALVCGLLIKAPRKIGKRVDLNPLVNTFVSTFASGGSFALMAIFINVISQGTDPLPAIIAYAAIVLATATFNAIMNMVLVPPLRKVLKR